ncbi:hypothetical protein BaRGS_00022656 [Batillaria attramentaria]|uniref:Uncharacterized protein n=1 Tax=Batillaria attramentaria TaxID=370345 RepID=A0ABD0KG69_9CAEN
MCGKAEENQKSGPSQTYLRAKPHNPLSQTYTLLKHPKTPGYFRFETRRQHGRLPLSWSCVHDGGRPPASRVTGRTSNGELVGPAGRYGHNITIDTTAASRQLSLRLQPTVCQRVGLMSYTSPSFHLFKVR